MHKDRCSTLLVLALCLVALAESKVASPCSACGCIAEELQGRLDAEPVRNHLDFRHRLDSQGQRYGKMVNYKISELRAVELLENLCRGMQKYTLVVVNSTVDGGKKTRHWEKLGRLSKGARRFDKSIEDVKQKQLEVHCGRILEEYEEDLTVAIQKGLLEEEGGVAAYLCGGLLKACPPDGIEAGGNSSSDDMEELPETPPGAAEAAAAAAEAADAAAEAAAATAAGAQEGAGQAEGAEPMANDEL